MFSNFKFSNLDSEISETGMAQACLVYRLDGARRRLAKLKSVVSVPEDFCTLTTRFVIDKNFFKIRSSSFHVSEVDNLKTLNEGAISRSVRREKRREKEEEKKKKKEKRGKEEKKEGERTFKVGARPVRRRCERAKRASGKFSRAVN